MSVTKNNLIKTLVKENGYPLDQTVDLIETLLEIIKSTLASGEDVLISGFGKILCSQEARKARAKSVNR
jgi:integration host factor subunit alpha